MGVVQLVRLVAFSSTNGPTAAAAAAAGWLFFFFFFALWSPVLSERFISQRISTQKISRSKQQKRFSTHDHTHTHRKEFILGHRIARKKMGSR
jgi:hypothetical protein